MNHRFVRPAYRGERENPARAAVDCFLQGFFFAGGVWAALGVLQLVRSLIGGGA